MSLVFNVTVNDNVGGYASYAQLIRTDLLYAGSVWAGYINSNASIEVEVDIAPSPIHTADGTAATSVFLRTQNGNNYFEFGTIAEMLTGQDPNGNAPDVIIHVDPQYIDQSLYFDPNPSPTSNVPSNKVDAVEVFEHELGHAFGFNGFRVLSTGASQGSLSTYDVFVTTINGTQYFTGPQAEAVYGGPIPLTANNFYHVGNQAGSGHPGSDLLNDMMNGVIGFLGKSPGPSALDLAILADAGVPMSTVVQAATVNDFNGDGKSDILWRNDGGPMAIWDMNDGNLLSSNPLGSVPANWKVAGTGDFNGDHKTDILWRNDAGAVAIWDMNDNNILASNSLGSVPANWHIAGTGDFNGDHKTDILWRNDAGAIAIWDMNDGNLLSSNSLGSVPANWHIAGTGDFNGDHKSDILWRNDAGVVAVWDMNDGNLLSSNSLGSVPANWHIAGTGDFNGDDKTDILWRNDAGAIAIWDMNDGTLVSSNPLGSVPAAWKIADIGDYNGDHKSDILWRNDTGPVAIWDMNDGTLLSSNPLGSVPANWHIIA
jgi:hypothetical protein